MHLILNARKTEEFAPCLSLKIFPGNRKMSPAGSSTVLTVTNQILMKSSPTEAEHNCYLEAHTVTDHGS